MSTLTTGNERQYANSRNLDARARLHRNYTIAETDWFSWVAGHLPIKAGDNVADIGCGPGWLWAQTAREWPSDLELTLTDHSTGMVDEAVGRCKLLPFAIVEGRQADAAALPFDDASFDVVTAMHMLYHLSEPAKAIAEMHRVLKPGGSLAVTTNGKGNLHELYEFATIFGSPPIDPSAAAFGFDEACEMLASQFGNVRVMRYPAHLRVTDPEDIFLTLTSYPPGDEASTAELAALREAIEHAFRASHGQLTITKEVGLFVSLKAP